MAFVQVVVDFPDRWADGTYTYSVPDSLRERLAEGWAVRVPFGKRQLNAYVVKVFAEAPETDFELKAILEVLGEAPVWTAESRDLAAWMSEFYLCTLVEAFQTVVPPVVIRRLLKPVRTTTRKNSRSGLQGLGEEAQEHALNSHQLRALEGILAAPATSLLEGITGSGKTEVYLAAIEHTLARGRGAIVLVPEVSLTPQAIDRYRGRLGENVAVLHSRLSDAERAHQWRLVQSGTARVALGTRSAIFAPIQDLGLIVIDEEHDSSYKQDNAPRYHARQVAAWRVARHPGCSLVLGSATPCLESYTYARAGQFRHWTMSQRATEQKLPSVEMVDLRKYRLRSGEDLSGPLFAALEVALEKGQQAVLLYNRRGFSRYLQCQDCGEVTHCQHCSIAMTVHHAPRRLLCHYCGHQRSLLNECPKCSGSRLREQGSGTEHLEIELAQRLPRARILRMDRDTTQRQGSHGDLLTTFGRGDADILLGTQMVAKGLDFPNVTLVGVIGADQGLHLPDFRAAERTLQLLVQVSGRAGRGQEPGRVLLQAMDADQPVFDFARRHDYPGFLDYERDLRRALRYPPFCRLGRLLLSSEDEQAVQESAQQLSQWFSRNQVSELEVLGPSACPLEKIQGFFRWHFLFKARRVKDLAEILRNALRQCKRNPLVRWAADVDPQSLL